MSLERVRSARAQSKTDWTRVRREDALGIEPAPDSDSPDASTGMRSAILSRRAGRPKVQSPRVMVSMRVAPEVLEAFKQRAAAEGIGYQSLMHDVLRKFAMKVA